MDGGPTTDAIGRILALARAHFGMDVAFVSEFDGGRRVFRYVDTGPVESVVRVGASDPLEESFCQRVVDGRLPEVLVDAAAHPVAAALPATAAVPVGAHLSVPIVLRDGQVFGTLCCFKSEPDASLNERDGATMHLLAAFVADHVQRTGNAPAAPVAGRDEELRALQLAGWPAVAVLVVCTLLFSIEHLGGEQLWPTALERTAAVLGLAALVVLGVVTAGWVRVGRRLVQSSTELAQRHAVDLVARIEGETRLRHVEAVLAGSDPFQIVFQPVFDLRTDAVVGHEALSRFPGGGGPDVWFADAHAVGLGVELELLAVTEAIHRFHGPGYLAVNVSPAALSSAALQHFLRQSPDASSLVLELTEHAVIDDYDLIATSVQELRRLGIRLAVDDAGAGYASMRHILGLRPDIVKLDRSLIDGVDQDAARQALVESLTRFANGIDATVVAEGVERPEELETCRRLGVGCAQGYLLGRPQPDLVTAPGTSRGAHR